jgi:hypothetical protein
MSFRSAITTLISTCAILCSAYSQVLWSYYDLPPGQAYSVIGLGNVMHDGSFSFTFHSGADAFTENRLLLFSMSGELLSTDFDTVGFWAVPTPVPGGGVFRAVARQLPDHSVSAWIAHLYTDDGVLIRSDTIPFDPLWPSKAVVHVSPNGEAHVLHAMKTSESLQQADRLLCIRLDLSTGNYVSRLLAGDSFWPQRIHAHESGYQVYFLGGSFFPQIASPVGQVVSFNRDFDFIGGYVLPSLSGLPGMTVGETTTGYAYDGFMQDDGAAIVVYKILTPIALANEYVVRTSANGVVEEVLAMPLGNLASTADGGALTRALDGTFIWAIPCQSAAQVTRVYIFHFNEELDLLSQSLALNGFLTGHYYQPRILLATQDGNCVIAGEYRNEFTNPYGNAFVVKFAMPVGVGEAESGGTGFSLYPSPATDVLILRTAGGGVIGRWEIHDALGQLVLTGQSGLSMERVAVDALAPGFYSLQIDPSDGSPSVVRKWMKE